MRRVKCSSLTADERLLWRRGGGVGAEGAQQEHVGGVVAKGDALFLEGKDDAAAEFAEDEVALVGADADLNEVGDGAAFDLIDAEALGVGDGDVLEVGVVAEVVGDFAEDGDDFVGVGAGVDRDVEIGDGVVAGEIGDGGDLVVGDDVEGAVGVANGGAAEGEVLDGPLDAGDVDDLADVVLVFDENEGAVEHVLEDALRAEADRDAQNASRGEKWLVGDVQNVENLEEDDEAEDGVGGGPDNGSGSADLGGAVEVVYLVVGATAKAFDEEEDEAVQHEE